MPQYRANTDELRSAAKQLQNKANEMRAAIKAVDSAMNAPRGMESPRIAQDVAQWDQLKSQLMSNLGNAEQASQIITRTATDIDATMAKK